jgi:hypothetical protein
MTQEFDANGPDQFDDEDDDYFVDPYPLVSLELPPPHLEALKQMLKRINPQDEIEAEIYDTLMNFHPEVELEEIRQLAEFRSVLERYADPGGD